MDSLACVCDAFCDISPQFLPSVVAKAISLVINAPAAPVDLARERDLISLCEISSCLSSTECRCFCCNRGGLFLFCFSRKLHPHPSETKGSVSSVPAAPFVLHSYGEMRQFLGGTTPKAETFKACCTAQHTANRNVFSISCRSVFSNLHSTQ